MANETIFQRYKEFIRRNQQLFDWLARMILLLGVILAVASVWKIPQWQVADISSESDKERIELENKTRGTLAQVIGGVIAFYVVYLTMRRTAATEENVKVAQQTLDVSRKSQTTERFVKAIEQLGQSGNDKLTIRLGGIYALEQIAKDAPDEYHFPIMEVLTAYVREHALRKDLPQQHVDETSVPEDDGEKESPQQQEDEPPAILPTDIQAVLTVIGRRTRTYGQGERRRLELPRTDLRRADLRVARLEGVDLREAYLHEADLWGAELHETDLKGAHLDGAHLVRAHLHGVDLVRADLGGANLGGANLLAANLRGMDLRRVDGLTQKQIASATTDETTQLPDDLKEHGNAEP